MSPFNWKQFTKRIPINASVQAVYNAWTSQEQLEAWFLRLAAFTDSEGRPRSPREAIQAGDRYKWLWHGYDDNAKEEREILAVNGKDRLQFTFSGECIVTVEVLTEHDTTICSITQDMNMADEDKQRSIYLDCGEGWAFYLVNLKSYLEGGIDLRNRDVQIRKVISA